MSLASGLVLVVAITSVAKSQTEGPRPESWAVEAASGPSASLLRFRNLNSAWVIGANGTYTHQAADAFDPFSGTTTQQTQENISAQLKLGLRRYSDARSQVRRFSTVSAVVGFDRGLTGKGWRFGGAGELGAAYFFNARTSLGGSGELLALYQTLESSNSALGDRTVLQLQFSGFRLVGAIYF
jgi:hypothetical protein